MRKFMALVKEFSVAPNPFVNTITLHGNMLPSPGYGPHSFISPGTWPQLQPATKTPKELRDEADALEEADRQRAIATAKAQKESEERNARWQEYQAMIQKWDEVVK